MFNKRFYRNIYFYLIALLLISTLTLSGVLHYFSSRLITEEIYRSDVRSLESSVNNMDLMLEGLINVTRVISADSYVNAFLYKNFESDYIGLKHLIDSLDSIVAGNSYLDSVYVYYSDTKQLVTTRGGRTDISTFYDAGILEKLSFTGSSQWLLERSIRTRNSETGDASSSMIPRNMENVISYVHYLPVGAKFKTAAIIVNIDRAKLEAILSSNADSPEGMLVFDGMNRNIITTLQGDIQGLHPQQLVDSMVDVKGYKIHKSNGIQYLVSYSTGKNNWKYIMVTPLFALNSLSRIIRNVVIVATLLVLLVGFLMIFGFSRKLYLPVKHLLSSLETVETEEVSRNVDLQDKKVDEFKSIQIYVDSMKEHNRRITRRMEKAFGFAYERVILGLLHGNISLEELSNGEIKLPFDNGSHFVVLCFEMDDYKELVQEKTDENMNDLQDLISNACRENLAVFEGCSLQWIMVYPYQFAAILSLPEESVSRKEVIYTLYNAAANIRDFVKEAAGISISAGISTLGDQAGTLSILYRQAVGTLENRLIDGKGFVGYAGYSIGSEAASYFYPQNQEDALIAAIKSCDHEKAGDMLNALVLFINQNKMIGHKQVHYLFAQMIGAIVKEMYHMGVNVDKVLSSENIFEELSECKHIEEIRQKVMGFISGIIERIQAKEETRHEIIVMAAIKYMDENFSDAGIGLEKISSKVYVSADHLEKLFRSARGITVIEYLNRVRMEKARAYLRDTTFTIETIAGKVGYTTSRGFIRAFKNNEGVTPGQYRSGIQGNSINPMN